jgi:signal transduction histidine kinase
MSEGAPPPRRHRPRVTILVKLLCAFTLPAVGLFVLFALVAYDVTRRDLEAELGTRLEAIAASASTHLRGKYLEDLVPGEEDDRAYQGSREKLSDLARETGVARIYVFDREFAARVDTDEEVPIGTVMFQAKLDRLELERVFERAERASSLLFEGVDGELYKAGYAPVYADPDRDRSVVLAVGVDAPATFFERLSRLRRSLILYGALLAAAVMGVAVVVAALLTRPVRRLALAAERIGRGDLRRPIKRMSGDEIGFLAETMEEMRADLQARDERMQLMLSGIAHEVRNPLGGMELFAGILRDEIPKGDDRRRHVERIEKEVGHLKQVVTDFLEYARRPEPELGPVALGELARDICELAAGEAEAAGVKLRQEVDPVVCLGDDGQLRRVLLNLVRNAVQAAATANEKLVVVRVAAAGDRARVEVENHGPEIPPEARERVFEPFFTTREKGTGLGLAFAREIANDHGGRISVESNPERTTFTVELRTT